MLDIGRSLSYINGVPDKTALVTGGASGIGKAIVERLRDDGLAVAVLDLTPTDDPNSFVADVTDAGAVRRTVVEVREPVSYTHLTLPTIA